MVLTIEAVGEAKDFVEGYAPIKPLQRLDGESEIVLRDQVVADRQHHGLHRICIGEGRAESSPIKLSQAKSREVKHTLRESGQTESSRIEVSIIEFIRDQLRSIEID